jgi:hypothetical protein
MSNEREAMSNDYPACRSCIYWKKDYGRWTFNGWTGMDRDNGVCRYEPREIPKKGEDFCHHHTGEQPKP